MAKKIVRNPEWVATSFSLTLRRNPDESGLRLLLGACLFPGLPKRNPGLKLANAFSVIHPRLIPLPFGRCVDLFYSEPASFIHSNKAIRLAKHGFGRTQRTTN
jgi:hypothetical protein